MISKSQIKLITSLRQKKYRDKTGLFVAEGPKVILELLKAGFELHGLFSSEVITRPKENHYQISEAELKKISFLSTANTALAVFTIPTAAPLNEKGWVLALDAVRDPGNLGTLIRLCDWFGIRQLICSKDTADCYNPKVIQATMGSITRVSVHYVELTDYLQKTTLPVFGACMEGTNVYKKTWPREGILVLGNEANGISGPVMKLLQEQVTIPQFGVKQETESLNVATAGAILLSEVRRSTGK
ncbi:MAG: RNA methyltransferase [Altibacter sp.]|nr:RNA methyltransferase [Altibacter sp.]